MELKDLVLDIAGEIKKGMSEELQPHPWLPKETSQGDAPACQNCEHYEDKDDTKPSGICGCFGHVCGKWEESRQLSIKFIKLDD